MHIAKRAMIIASALFSTVLANAGYVKGKVSAPGLKSAENIAVYIDAIAGKKFDPPAQHVQVNQLNLAFTPRDLVILKGTTVDFLNSDHVAHNVFWSSIGGNKSLKQNMTVSPGQTKSYQFNNLGMAQILCNLHTEMVSHITVVPTPYFALTGADGSFTISNVPPGSYSLKSWSVEGKPATQAVTVADAPTNVQLTVSK
jgi:plastocyanin